jgi:hypothetical protein
MMAHTCSEQVERLWTSADGTVCLLATCDAPPLYAVSLVRNEKVVRECRFYGDASARMVAQSWEASLTGR